MPGVSTLVDLMPTRFDALNDGCSIVLENSPEDEEGNPDGARVEDLIATVGIAGTVVRLGFVDGRLGTEGDIKWDRLFRVDQIGRTTRSVTLGLVDALLLPGEKPIGAAIRDSDWPASPSESYGMVRGAVFGKVDGLPLVPVEVGLVATLAGEIDDQEKVIDVAGELSLWPDSGYVEIGDETVWYPVIDRAAKRLGGVAAPCVRGTGFPLTVAAGHSSGAVVRELYTGREAVLNGPLSARATSMAITPGSQALPSSGVVVVDGEAIRYTGKTGNTLTGLGRGVAVPTGAVVHDWGTSVRTIPSVGGARRYRYVVAEGPVSAVANCRGVDTGETGTGSRELALPAGVVPVVSEVTVPSGRVFTVADFAARPRLERFASSRSRVPEEWFSATDGTYDPLTGYALATSFLRWKAGPTCGANVAGQIPLCLDPAASTQAVILKTSAADRVLDLVFNGHFDGALNNPRRLFGRFGEARLRMRVQYDRNSTTAGSYEIRKNGAVVRNGTIRPPAAIAAGGAISGSQTLPRSRWGIQRQGQNVRLSRISGGFATSASGFWVDPSQGVPSNGSPVSQAATDGSDKTFVCGDWDFYAGAPRQYNTTQNPNPIPSPLFGDLVLQHAEPLREATSKDKLIGISITTKGVSGTSWQSPEYVQVQFFSDKACTVETFKVILRYPNTTGPLTLPAGFSWSKLQGIIIRTGQYVYGYGSNPLPGPSAYAVCVSEIQLQIQVDPYAEGQDTDTTVSGSYFAVSGVAVPSAPFEQVVSLGRLARDWGLAQGKDPWEFFSQGAPAGTTGGLEVLLNLPGNGDAVQLAVGMVGLEVDYAAPEVVYDAPLIADVDGRVGTPVGGGAAVVLENPVDLLAYLVDGAEFYGMGAYRDSATFVAARAEAEGAGIRCSRAVTGEVELRELMGSLCGENRLLLLLDGSTLSARWRGVDISEADAVMEIGDDAVDLGGRLLEDSFPRENRVEEFANQLGYYYRRNLVSDDFRTYYEVNDAVSQAGALGLRRRTLDLNWQQSARGYAGGLAGQRAAVAGLAGFGLGLAGRLWDFAQIPVSGAVGERLQRHDVVLVHHPRAALFHAPARVVRTERLGGPYRWLVTVMCEPGMAGYYWIGQTAGGALQRDTYVRMLGGGLGIEFVLWGVRLARLTAGGDLLLRGGVTLLQGGGVADAKLTGTPANSALRWDDVEDGGRLVFYLQRYDLPPALRAERAAWLTAAGDLVVGAVQDGGINPKPVRDLEAGADLGAGYVDSGIVDTGTGGVTGLIRFAGAGQSLMELGKYDLRVRGRVVAGGLR
jgi:hypothetical protein